MSDSGLDELREAVRVATERDSAREVAGRARLSHETVYAFLRGEPVSAKTLLRLQSAVRADSSARSGPSRVAFRSDDDSGVRLSERDYGYLCGTLDTLGRLVGGLELQVSASASTVHAVGDQLTALRGLIGQLGQAADGAAALVRQGGGAPTPPSAPTPNRPVADPAMFRTRDEAMGGSADDQTGGAAG